MIPDCGYYRGNLLKIYSSKNDETRRYFRVCYLGDCAL